MTIRAQLAACLALALTLGACGPSENDARQYLEQQGLTVTDLKKSGSSFDYTATKGNEICTGTVTVSKGFGSTNQSYMGTCQRDTSACKPGAAAECVKLADELYAREKKVFPMKAGELYRTACADGNGHACARAGEFETIGKAWDKVREFSEKGCTLDDGEACARLGFAELEGNGGPKDEARALTLMKKACSLSALRGCRAAAGILLDATPADPTAAIPLGEKLCTAKFEDGCFILGMALFDSKKDYPRALAQVDAACNDENHEKRGFACNIAGAITFDGLGMKKDPARGMAYLEKACEAGYAEGCANAATMYKRGSGVPRNPAKAAELSAKACALGKKEQCSAK